MAKAKVTVTGNTLTECKKNAQDALKKFFENAAFTIEYGDASATSTRDAQWAIVSVWQMEAVGTLSAAPQTPAASAKQ